MLVSIVLSFKNEETNLVKLIPKIHHALDSSPYCSKYEIIAINDCSTDHSEGLLRELSDSYPLKVFNTSRCFGVTPCLLFGLEQANGDYIGYLDSDLQDPPEILQEMIESAVNESADIVNTVRSERRGENAIKMFVTSRVYELISFLADIELIKNSGDFKLISRRALLEVIKNQDNDPYMRGLTSSVGFKNTYISYVRDSRFSGSKKFSLFKSLNPYREVLRAITLHSDIPLLIAAICSLIGITVAILSFISFLIWRINGDVVPGITLPVLLNTLLFSNIFISLLVINIYLARVLVETRRKKRVIISSTFSSENKQQNRPYQQ